MRTTFYLRAILVVAVAVVAVPAAHGGWSDDPSLNLVIADRPGDQVQPKIVATADGGCYVSWFDNAAGGYDVYLQRLDAAGNEQWAHNGVLIADRGFSWTQDYGLSIDAAGAALLAFRDDRSGGEEITAARVTPDGTLSWGAAGIQVSTAAGAFVASPKIAGTSEGHVVVAWSEDGAIRARKLDPTGAPLWGAGITFTPASGSYFLADLHAADAGAAIVSWVPQNGGISHLWAQKLAAADGASLWGSGHVQVFDDPSGGLGYGNFPPFVPDGAGGALFAWSGSFGMSTIFTRVQRILADGSEAFVHNGIETSTDTSLHRLYGTAILDPASGDVYAFWTSADASQSQFGISGQRIAADGSRMWTDAGRVYVPLGSSQTDGTRLVLLSGEPIAAWVDGIAFGNEPIRAMRADAAGDPVWTPDIVDLCTSATDSYRLGVVASTAGFAIYAWQDGSIGDTEIRVQNLSPDGVLGETGGIFADGFESGDTTAWSDWVP